MQFFSKILWLGLVIVVGEYRNCNLDQKVKIIDQLPLTSRGKIDRKALQELKRNILRVVRYKASNSSSWILYWNIRDFYDETWIIT